MDFKYITLISVLIFTLCLLLSLSGLTNADKSRCICSDIGEAGSPPVRLQCLYVCGSIQHRGGGIAALPVKRRLQPQISNEIGTQDYFSADRNNILLYILRLLESLIRDSRGIADVTYEDDSSY